MKKNYFYLFVLLGFILYILTHPAVSMNAALDGLLLWYRQVLPSLLPLAILSNIMVYSNYMQIVTKYLYPITRHLVCTSENGCFAFLGGILFGFPMGSKISADLLAGGNISREEGEILAICFNQLSPVFVSGYLLHSILNLPGMTLVSYAVLYLPPLFFARRKLRSLSLTNHKSHCSHKKITASDSRLNFRIIDAGIMNGFESLTKLGGYIILFSIFASMLRSLNTNYPVINLIAAGLVEVTTGISGFKTSTLPPGFVYSLAMFFSAFGGLCGFAQTCSMTKDCGFSRLRYLGLRLLFAAASGCMAYVCYFIGNITLHP